MNFQFVSNIRDHALQVITVASAFRSATAVGVRRASLYALRLAFEAYLPASATAAAVSSSTGNHPASRALSQQQARLSARRGPLDTLLHLSGEDALLGVDAGGDIAGDGTSAVSSEAVAMSIMSQPAVVDTVDWAASSWKDDPDEVSRTLKHEIVSMAVRVLS